MGTNTTAHMIEAILEQGYKSVGTFATTHNPKAKEIRLYSNGESTLLLYVHHDFDCDLFMEVKETACKPVTVKP